MVVATTLAELTRTAMSLDMCRAGDRIRVIAVDEHEDQSGCRLREVGLFEGARAEVVSQGDPVVLNLLGSRFAVCRRCARRVTVVGD